MWYRKALLCSQLRAQSYDTSKKAKCFASTGKAWRTVYYMKQARPRKKYIA
jgi:hypothetical protein